MLLQGFPGAAARFAVFADRQVIFAIVFSGIEDNSAVMTQNTGEQTLFVVFGASVSDNSDIYANFACMTFASSLQNVTFAKISPQCISGQLLPDSGVVFTRGSMLTSKMNRSTSWSNIVHFVQD